MSSSRGVVCPIESTERGLRGVRQGHVRSGQPRTVTDRRFSEFNFEIKEYDDRGDHLSPGKRC